MEFYLCGLDPKHAPRLVEKRIRWGRPIQGWMKLNTDGSSLGNPRIARSGGVVRDEQGNWIVGFSRRIGKTTSYLAELSLCLERNFLAVEVELDAKLLVDALSSPIYSSVSHSVLLDDCRQLSTRFRQIRFSHCYREANGCADGLARKGAVQSDGFVLFNNPPVDLETRFNFDLNGLYSLRRCSVSLPPWFY